MRCYRLAPSDSAIGRFLLCAVEVAQLNRSLRQDPAAGCPDALLVSHGLRPVVVVVCLRCRRIDPRFIYCLEIVLPAANTPVPQAPAAVYDQSNLQTMECYVALFPAIGLMLGKEHVPVQIRDEVLLFLGGP